ncbi:unnamed protein product [Rotaria magnacalcarata]|uniref:Sulfotransferase n=2 Tax=Rotaria magnacalcarata TaxID=392030 RepID=A0A815XNN8_9BILA|nr:unnamed protein product [Rotaria magnacalcarata]CAF2120271.1 unnamed protein product [Rotaria magnacalcarata]CAF4034957.1 unnamed protein product [Rotaria magnacalcarata]CAF4644982.1 unnamed protein product [Rotaria magnacalcarata]
METETQCDVVAGNVNSIIPNPILRKDVVLCDDDLSAEAKVQFDFHSEILQAFQLNARIVLANDRLTPIGRHLFCTSVEQNYKNCKDVLNYVASHSELQTAVHPMPPLFVLCGAARTGTTLLYNLLACDPACRAPLLQDMTNPVPPLARSDSTRSTFAQKLSDPIVSDYERDRNASHPCFKYEEDVNILYQSGLLVPHLEPPESTELATWFYNDTNKDFAYKYHKTFMKMINSVDAPQSHWLLKTPYHIFNLDTLIRHYPSASLIMTHRRLHDVLPSSVRLGLAFASIYFDSNRHDAAIDKKTIVERRLRATDIQINRIVEFRRAHSHASVFDVLYDDLIEKPIDTVHCIYNHFGLKWSEEFEQAMITWLRDNPQGKQGRNSYTLEEFGLTHDAIEQKYEEYNRMFLNREDILKTDDGATKSANSTPDNIITVADSIE